jgi:hypothetical protein
MNGELPIYLHVSGEQTGPFSIAQIQEQLDANQITAETLAWHEGLPEWRPVTEIVRQSSSGRNRRRKRSKSIWIVGFLIMLALAAMAYWKWNSILWRIKKLTSDVPTESEQTPWQVFSVAGLRLKAPAPFVAGTSSTSESLSSSESHESVLPDYKVGITKYVFKPDAPINIDGTVRGIISFVTNQPNATNVKHDTVDFTLPTASGRRVSVHADTTKGKIRLEGVVIRKDTTVWIIGYSFPVLKPRGEELTKESLDSMQIAD